MSNSVQYDARTFCKFAGFYTAGMHVAIGLRAVARWPDAHRERISERISFQFPQLWPDASLVCYLASSPFSEVPLGHTLSLREGRSGTRKHNVQCTVQFNY